MKIEHVALLTKNLEQLRSFYEKYFEAKAGPKYRNPKTGFESYFLTFPGDGTRLELMFKPGVCERCGDERSLGFVHLSFSVGSKEVVDELTNRLHDEGFYLLSAPRITGDGYYESCIADPDGNSVEITV